MHLDPFELHRPASVEDAVACAEQYAGQSDYLGGGTDLLPNYKMHINLRPHVIALDGVTELAQHDLTRIGAMTRLADLETDATFAGAYPGLFEAVRDVATPLVRASGTVGGNLLVETRCFFFNQSYFWRQSLGFCLKADGDACHVVPQKERCYATFSGDLAPALAVLGARVEIAGASGRRDIPLLDMYDAKGDGIHRHRLAPGELVVAVHLPEDARRLRSTYLKLRIRPSFDFPELGVAAAAEFSDGRVERLRLVVGGLETYPRDFSALTDPLHGAELGEPEVRTLAEAVQRTVRPVHNTFLAPDYRKRMTGVYVRRALDRLRGLDGRSTG